MAKSFEQGRGSAGHGDVAIVSTTDPRYDSWEDYPLGVDFRILQFAEIVPHDTDLSEVKDKLKEVTGGESFRLGARTDPETEARWKANIETAASVLTIEKSSMHRLEELKVLRKEFEDLAERYPEEAWSIEQQIMDLEDTRAIGEENSRKDYDDLITMLYADYHAKLQAAAEESNRNLRMVEEHKKEITFSSTDKKIADFFKDEMQ